MYSPPSSHRRQVVKQIAIYALMTAAVLSIVFMLILVMLGYRFDRAARTIEQGGLVQLNSIPSGANLTIDAAKLSATTSTKTTLTAGKHTITMSRKGYAPWQKTVDVKKGAILWLNYARLIPDKLTVETVAQLPAVTSTVPSPNRKLIAMTTEQTTPDITLIDISSDKPKLQTLTLPEGSYTLPEDVESQRFVVNAWSASSRYVLVKHIYDDKNEWLVVDAENVAQSKNITVLFDVAVSDVQFSQNDDLALYVLMNGDVRKMNIEAATISAPLVRNVAEFSFYDESIIVYTTTIDPATKSRSVGYRTDGANEPRVIRTYSDDGMIPLHVTIDKYYNRTYVALAYGTTVEILSGSLPKSDSTDPLSLAATATMAVPETIAFLSSRTEGRFFIAQHGKSYSVYDLELQKATTTPLRGEGSVNRELGWIDGYRTWSNLDGTLRLYEFDGANQHDIMPMLAGQNPVLSTNGRYLYAPTQDEAGVFQLSRVRLIL